MFLYSTFNKSNFLIKQFFPIHKYLISLLFTTSLFLVSLVALCVCPTWLILGRPYPRLIKRRGKYNFFVKVIPKSHMTLRRISRIKAGNMISDMISEDRKPNSELWITNVLSNTLLHNAILNKKLFNYQG